MKHAARFPFLELTLAMIAFAIPSFSQNRQLKHPTPAPANKKRIAPDIGNRNCTSARKLDNPVNDANGVCFEIRKLGFEVISGTDLDRWRTTERVREFGDRLSATLLFLTQATACM